jgi:hypothetical protein
VGVLVSSLAACTGLWNSHERDDPDGPPGAECREGLALAGESQRLDPIELQATVDDLFGFHVALSPGYPAPSVSAGYLTYPEANRIDQADIGTIADTADAAALSAIERLGDLLPCDPAAIDEACATSFIDDFAGRAYRGTYDAGDAARLIALYHTLRGGDPALDEELAIAGVISAVLQSPGVLYMIERGEEVEPGLRELTGREIATRLAYVFWDAPPDETLLDAAGSLREPSRRRAQAERLLEDPRARGAVVRFFRSWMRVEGKDFSDRTSPEIARALEEELRRYVEDVVFERGEGGLNALFTGDRTWVNRSLAEHYDLSPAPADDETWTLVSLPPHLAGGIFTRGAVAAAHSADGVTSVVKRGHFIREDVLCQELGNPPADAISRNPVLPSEATVRERMEARSSVSECGGCHTQMDPIGIGMEDIDEVGRFRTSYEESGYEVDSAGVLSHFGRTSRTVSFDGTAALAALLAEDESVAHCVSEQWFRFAMGREDGSACNAASMLERFRESGYDLREMLLALVESDGFVQRVEEP